MVLLQRYLSRQVGKGRWIEVEKEDWEAYEGLWRDGTEEIARKRSKLDRLKAKWWSMRILLCLKVHRRRMLREGVFGNSQ